IIRYSTPPLTPPPPPPPPYPLSLHDALPISTLRGGTLTISGSADNGAISIVQDATTAGTITVEDGSTAVSSSPFTGVTSIRLNRSEEHTSELQSRFDLVCRLLLEKKKNAIPEPPTSPRRRLHPRLHHISQEGRVTGIDSLSVHRTLRLSFCSRSDATLRKITRRLM